MYTASGFEGQLKGKKVVIINSRGLSYAEEAKSNGHVRGYLKTVLGFIGITDIDFVYLNPTLFGKEAIEAAKARAREKFATIIDGL